MATKTENYNLGIFDYNDNLSTPSNIQIEKHRFLRIDTQLYGLYNIFGNGVISGWDVSDNAYNVDNGISIRVKPGKGVISYTATETKYSYKLNNLPSNKTLYIYAKLINSITEIKSAIFVYSEEQNSNSNNILISKIITGSNSILSIDNTVKEEIGFKSIIDDQISLHKHRGSPSKIDLTKEVKNQLPSYRLDSINIDKIKGGIIDSNLLPVIDHNQLKNNGVLSHAQLDTFVDLLSRDNRDLLGEITSSNFIKQTISLKHNYNDIDNGYVNTFIYIPGVSSSSLDDSVSTTANINTSEKCISGTAASTENIVTVNYNEDEDFDNYYSINKLQINNGVKLDKNVTNNLILENFENKKNSQNVSSFSVSLENTKDDNEVLYDSDNVNEGVLGGKFISSAKYKTVYTKNLNNIDASNYDTLSFYVKSSNSNHKPVFMYFVHENENGEEILSEEYDILTTNEIVNNFEEREYDITGDARSNLTKLIIYTEDIDDDFEFYLDSILLKNKTLYQKDGEIIFRYNAQANVKFHSLDYDIDTSDNTEINIRIRVSPDNNFLTFSDYTGFLKDGEVFNKTGNAIEINVQFKTSDNLETPILNNLILNIKTSSDENGYTVDSKNDFEKGEGKNIYFKDEEIEIQGKINVEGISYLTNGTLQEIDGNNIPILGFDGSNALFSLNELGEFNSGLDNPLCMYRDIDKKYLVCDTYHDRIMLYDKNGIFIKGIGSSYWKSNDFYVVASSFNPENDILYIACSNKMEKDFINIENISIYVGSNLIQLSSSNAEVLDMTSSGYVFQIKLKSNIKTSIELDINNLRLFLKNDSFDLPFKIDDNVKEVYSNRGLTIFYGDFIFMDGIINPVYCYIENNNWIFGSSAEIYNRQSENSEYVFEKDFIPYASYNEYDIVNNLIVNSKNNLLLNDFTLGSYGRYNDSYLYCCGIYEKSEDNSESIDSDIDFINKGFDQIKKYAGKVLIVEEQGEQIIFSYDSPDGLYPSNIKKDGDYLWISESSFVGGSGRIIKIDLDGNIVNSIMGNYRIIKGLDISDNELLISL